MMKTNEEYLAEGYKPEEIAIARRADEIFNKQGLWTPAEMEEYISLCNIIMGR
jgi:hypothetical protein